MTMKTAVAASVMGLALVTAGATGGSAMAADPVKVYEPGSGYTTKPSTLTVAVGDGGWRVEKLTWTTWKSELAKASGTEVKNDCKPSCANGTLHRKSVHVLLDRVDASKHFTRVTVIYSQKTAARS